MNKKICLSVAIAVVISTAGIGTAASSQFEAKAEQTVIVTDIKGLDKKEPQELDKKSNGDDKEHWVIKELAEYKQFIVLLRDSSIAGKGPITLEEWEQIHSTVLDAEKLDEPINIDHWCTLLKMAFDQDKPKSPDMLKMYVYGLADAKKITRQDAVGGLVKLLTMGYISGSATAEELAASHVLKDLKDADFRQENLIRKAYSEGLLDAATTEFFRPKDHLTNAEAISMVYRVMKKYMRKTVITLDHLGGHWAVPHIKDVAELARKRESLAVAVGGLVAHDKSLSVPAAVLDAPISVKEWNDLIMNILAFDKAKYDDSFLQNYTYGIAKDGRITRGAAVAGLVKLLHASEAVAWRDATPKERELAGSSFKDYQQSFDASKLAIALTENLVTGYENQTFGPDRPLTRGEALTLAGRIIKRYRIT